MPWVNPMLFGTSSGVDAIIEFGNCSSGGAPSNPIYNSPITVINDSKNLLGTPDNNDVTYKWVPLNSVGDYEFSIIEPAVFASKETSASVIFGHAVVNTVTPIFTNFTSVFTVYTDSQQLPSPTQVTITDNPIYVEALALQFPSLESYNFSGMKIGIKKL